MTDHQCPYVGGLTTCPDHPKWHVVGAAASSGRYYWSAYAPNGVKHEYGFETWREAYDFAYARALLTATAAVTLITTGRLT